MMSPHAVNTVWGVSLVLGVIVLVVVTVLLELIRRTAGEIRTTVADIWTAGKGVANNTIHIALLHRTNFFVAKILEAAAGILGAASAIRAHAQGCPRCPSCAARR
jgi:hypothetical protein